LQEKNEDYRPTTWATGFKDNFLHNLNKSSLILTQEEQQIHHINQSLIAPNLPVEMIGAIPKALPTID